MKPAAGRIELRVGHWVSSGSMAQHDKLIYQRTVDDEVSFLRCIFEQIPHLRRARHSPTPCVQSGTSSLCLALNDICLTWNIDHEGHTVIGFATGGIITL